MALPAIAEPDELAGWLGIEFTEAQEERAVTVLAHASSAVRVAARRSWVNADGDELEGVPAGIPELVVQVAARMWANPSGVEQEAKGPFSVRHGAIGLTDAEKDAVASAVRAAEGTTWTGGLWTMSTTRVGPDTRTWVEVAGQANEPIEVSRVPW